MASKWKVFLFVGALFVMTCPSGQDVRAESDGDLVARVGTIPVTTYELVREIQRLVPLNSTYHGGLSKDKVVEVKEQALDAILERTYKVQYALEEEISVPNDAVDQRLEKIWEKFKTPEALQEALGKESLVAFRASVYRMLLADKAEEVAVKSKATVSDDEVRAFYEENKAMYRRPKQYKVSHILVKVDPTLVGAAREKLFSRAVDLAAKAKAGDDFYNLAYYNSDDDTKFVGGDLGYFHSGQVVKEFEDAIVNLQPGEIVGPVETISGFHVIKLAEVQDERLLNFDEIAGKLRKTMEEKKYAAIYNEWMGALKKKYSGEILSKM